MTTVTNLHREGCVEIMTVDTGHNIFRVCSVADASWDGVKIPIINGVEDRTASSLIGINQIQRLKQSAGESA